MVSGVVLMFETYPMTEAFKFSIFLNSEISLESVQDSKLPLQKINQALAKSKHLFRHHGVWGFSQTFTKERFLFLNTLIETMLAVCSLLLVGWSLALRWRLNPGTHLQYQDNMVLDSFFWSQDIWKHCVKEANRPNADLWDAIVNAAKDSIRTLSNSFELEWLISNFFQLHQLACNWYHIVNTGLNCLEDA